MELDTFFREPSQEDNGSSTLAAAIHERLARNELPKELSAGYIRQFSYFSSLTKRLTAAAVIPVVMAMQQVADGPGDLLYNDAVTND